MPTIQKLCCVCQKDVSQQKRTKDQHGRYYCHACWAASVRVPVPTGLPAGAGSLPPTTAETPCATKVSDRMNDPMMIGSPNISAGEKLILGFGAVTVLAILGIGVSLFLFRHRTNGHHTESVSVMAAGTKVQANPEQTLRQSQPTLSASPAQPTSTASAARPVSNSELTAPSRLETIDEAVKAGHIERIKALLDVKPDLIWGKYYGGVHQSDSEDMASLLGLADTAEVAKLLLERGADPRYLYPLRHAIETYNLPVAEILIAHGADINRDDKGLQHTLFDDIMDGPDDYIDSEKKATMLKFLLKHGGHSYQDRTPEQTLNRNLLFQVKSCASDLDLQRVKFWVELGADTSVKDADGNSLYQIAFATGRTDLIEYIKKSMSER